MYVMYKILSAGCYLRISWQTLVNRPWTGNSKGLVLLYVVISSTVNNALQLTEMQLTEMWLDHIHLVRKQ